MTRTALAVLPTPRPSSAERWCGAGCRGSVALAARYPQTTSAHAENGTRLHGLAATALKGGPRVYNAEDAKVVDPYITDVQKEHWSRPGSELWIEKEVSWEARQELKGTPDAVLFDPHQQRIIIWDLKTGWRLVEAWENWQLLCYAVMLCFPGWTVELRIVQPLPYHPDGSVRSWEVTWEQLHTYKIKIALALNEAMSANPPLRPGKHCLYCEALPGCPAAREVTLGAVEYATREPVDLPDQYVGRELAILRETVKILQLRLGALEESVAAKLWGGAQIPGVAMTEGGGGRIKWAADDNVVRETLRMLTGVDYAVPHIPTPVQLREKGLSMKFLEPLTKYQPGKMVVSTDIDDRAKKVFGNPPNMDHAKESR